MRFVASFTTFLSLLHFSRTLWSYRNQIPPEATLIVEWGWLRIPVKGHRG